MRVTALGQLLGVLALLGSGLDIEPDVKPERDYGRVCLALVGFSEARDQSDEGLALVMFVVLNRMRDPAHRWPQTICDVATQPGQFLGLERWPTPRRPEALDAAGWERSLHMADEVIAGTAPIPSACARATSFNQDQNAGAASCRVGAHTFYADPMPLTAALKP